MAPLCLKGFAAVWAMFVLATLAQPDVKEWSEVSQVCPPMKGEERIQTVLMDGWTGLPAKQKVTEIIRNLGASETTPTVVTFWMDSKGTYDPVAQAMSAEREIRNIKEAAPGKVEFHDLWLADDPFDPVKWEQIIARSHIFYGSGGNTFMQLAAARKRNDFFQNVVMKRLRTGSMLYLSWSAGSLDAGREIGIFPDPRPTESDWWYNGGSHRGLSMVNCIVFPHYKPDYDYKIANYRHYEMSQSSCPDCAIVRFRDYTEALYWPGNGSDVIMLSSTGDKPLPLLIGGTDTKPRWYQYVKTWVWVAVALALIASSVLGVVLLRYYRSKQMVERPSPDLPESTAVELGITSGSGR